MADADDGGGDGGGGKPPRRHPPSQQLPPPTSVAGPTTAFHRRYKGFTDDDRQRLRRLRKLRFGPLPGVEEEARRLLALRSSQLVDSDTNDPVFDRFASLAKRIFGVETARPT